MNSYYKLKMVKTAVYDVKSKPYFPNYFDILHKLNYVSCTEQKTNRSMI